MKTILTVLASIFLLQCSTPPKATDNFDKLLDEEALGNIKLGQKEEAVLKILGKRGSTGKNVLWEATGDWVQEWKFPAQGISLNMASQEERGTKSVLTITGAAGCKVATARGIKIGSSETAVRNAYGDLENKEESEAGKSFVAGSIYGGVIFSLKDGKVEQIFIGAGAE